MKNNISNGNYYFTEWIKNHSKEEFKILIDSIVCKINYPIEFKKHISKDEFIASYSLLVYSVISMKYFGLNDKQISMCLDIAIGPATSKTINPKLILEAHKDVIPEIERYIKMDFEKYYN